MRIDEISKSPAEKKLEQYTENGSTMLSPEEFRQLVRSYPYDGGSLYRGLHFSTKEGFDAFKEKIQSGTMTTTRQSSWTQDAATAKDFAGSKKSFDPTPQIMRDEENRVKSGDYMTGYGGVVISVTVPAKVGIDIDKTDFAKETEVLLPPGEYQVKIVHTQFAFSHEYKDREHELVARLSSSDDVERAQALEFLEKNISKLKRQSDVDKVVLATLNLDEISYDFYVKKSEWKAGNAIYFSLHGIGNPNKFLLSSDKIKQAVVKRLKMVLKQIDSDIKNADLTGVNHIGDPRTTYISYKILKMFCPLETSKVFQPLKVHFSTIYHEANKGGSLKTRSELEQRTEILSSAVEALSALS